MPLTSRKIKVIQVIADSSLGGGPKHVLGLLKHLNHKKYEIFLICPPGYLAEQAREIDGLTIRTMLFRSKFDLGSWNKFNQIVNEIRADDDPFGPLIIHSHGPRAGLVSRLHRIPGAKYVYTEHLFTSDYHLGNRLNEWFQKIILAYFNHRSDRIIAVSSAVKDFLVESRLAPNQRTIVIPNAIEKTKSEKRDSKKIRLAPIIGTIGNLNRQKGHRFLIEAFARIVKKYPLATLEIIGEGGERKKLERMIKSLGLEHRVTLLGKKNDPAKYLKHWSVFVLPSLAETFGLVLLEAFAAGVPVIATRVGGVPDIVSNNENGLLVRPHQSVDLARAIERVANDKKFASELVEAGRERLKAFTWDKVVVRVETLYDELSNNF